MSKISDQKYLTTEQYRDDSNLNARIALHARFSVNRYGWQRWIFDQLDLPPQCRILELGCGPGDLWRENLARLPTGWHIALTDLSAGMVQQARQRLGGNDGHFAFGVADAQAIPLPDESLEAVIANHMLYHVPDVSRALAEAQRVLKPGGRFYASTIGQAHMAGLHALVSRFAPQAGPWGGSPPRSFLLENGGELLAGYFEGVTLQRYQDALLITEAGPLVAYVQSMIDGPLPGGASLEALAAFVEREIAARGAIRIAKDSGLFAAHRKK